jgi:glycosyltransferase involved in cell wall biosynthesis
MAANNPIPEKQKQPAPDNSKANKNATPGNVQLIVGSKLFDEEFYVSTFLNGKAPKEGAIMHYLSLGADELFNPNEFFDTQYYLDKYPDVKADHTNPLVHFILYGVREGRDTSLKFQTGYYLKRHKDVAKSGLNPLFHYLHYGKKEGRPAYLMDQSRTYEHWIQQYDTLTPDDIRRIKAKISDFSYKPLISVLVPVYKPDLEHLKKAVDSVISQFYPYWELCLADDASHDPELEKVMNAYAKADPRIKVVYREKNGHISEATNSALEIASGEFIALLDQDDELRTHSLFMMAGELNKNKKLSLLYSDEDKIDEKGQRYDPHFKPEWSPDLLYGQNYISHLGVFRTSIVKEVGGFRKGFEGSQDFDLVLRISEKIKSNQIKRIPAILYHWRAIAGSTATNIDEKGYAMKAGIKALQEHFDRTHVKAHVQVSPLHKQLYRVKRELPEVLPLVSLIIPTKDRTDLVDNCVQSILKKSTYPNIEIIIVDNNSDKPESHKYFKKITQAHSNVKVLPYPHDFNYSAINNFAVKNSKGSVIGLVNNDIEVIAPDWLEEMVGHALRKEVGAVGANLFYENNTIQHAGVIIGLGGVAGHIHKRLPRHHPGYFCRALLTQNLTAVTAACVIMRRDVFEKVNGLNEKDLTVAFNDVDLCLKIRDKGLLIVWTPFAELYHLESISRGLDTDPDKVERFRKECEYIKDNWDHVIKNDPYFNPNFSLDIENYELAFPPRAITPWYSYE